MKQFGILVVLLAAQNFGFTQVESGTVVLVALSNGEVTMAADSRGVMPSGNNDSACKILVFDNRFIFAMAGFVATEDNRWNAISEAFEAWKQEKPLHSKAPALVHAVAESWGSRMSNIYGNDPDVVAARRKQMAAGDEPILANVAFAATDSSGAVIVHVENVLFNLALYDLKHRIEISVEDSQDLKDGQIATMGREQIFDEFSSLSTPRAREDMVPFIARMKSLNPSDRQAEYASHMVELTIQLDAKRDDLGLPVDVVQLRPKSGVYFRSVKPNCHGEYEPAGKKSKVLK